MTRKMTVAPTPSENEIGGSFVSGSDRDPHTLSVEYALAAFEATRAGLSATEAAERLARHGPNRLPETARRDPILRFLAHFNNVLIYVLLGAAATTATLDHYADTAVILAVVFANAIIGFIQEGQAEQAMESIRQMLAPHTTILRDGERHGIDSVDVVPGDVVFLEPGERVPADLRLFEATGLRIDEAILTGESVPVEKNLEPVAQGAAIGDRNCMAFSGTLITGGSGRGLVVATGATTEIGRIGGMISTIETLTTPLVEQMDRFARWLTILILLIASVLLAYGYFVSHLSFVEIFMNVVGLSVAAIPEGLPAVMTIALAVGVKAMARRNAIVRRLPAIETLGAVSVICTDKTGTLTRNEMIVATAMTTEGSFTVSLRPAHWWNWRAQQSYATTPPCAKPSGPGTLQAIPWKARFLPSQENSTSFPMAGPGMTRYRSTPCTASWQFWLKRLTKTALYWSRVPRNACCQCVRRNEARVKTWHSTMRFGIARHIALPRKASVFWLSRCKVRRTTASTDRNWRGN